MNKIGSFFWLNILDKSNILSQQKKLTKICVTVIYPQQLTNKQLTFLNPWKLIEQKSHNFLIYPTSMF